MELVRDASRVVVFTGAGVSAESGLDTYRNDESGLWERVDPEAMASIDAWRRDPEPMWSWYLWRAHLARTAEPNAGHRAVARWAQLCSVTVVTQNIDDLHERAGSDAVVHLHGSLFEFRCTECADPFEVDDFPAVREPRMTPPACPRCGAAVRPGVVWFGEALPAAEWERAAEAMADADLVVIVGTSGVVQPAASLPLLAVEAGVPVLEITPAPTELTRIADVSWSTTAARGLPALVDAVRHARDLS
ncbi:SIR2 family NAD-dependent protein deacylase [Corynebacterium sp. TAE3-ERU16]|uniref:SIR2 family NAD-dependent protein deacylase n=1 Tax=Corynebacterium sp. TAE3-ERU16 TaxID=2849493 RepID=UPI001C4903C9|nr:NAD-dependent deacylase [Corynebacterium sp. TAE3-ERU16]MBV7293865.1 NAD-dependent deacylase [Corynebacterium sp. TAE3-ERU16]